MCPTTNNPCAICGHDNTDSHDNCIKNLPNVKYACCGHGNAEEAYISFGNVAVYGPVALDIMRDLGGCPPDTDGEQDSTVIVFSNDGLLETYYELVKVQAVSIEIDGD